MDPMIDADFFESRRQVGEDFLVKLVEVFGQEAPKLINQIKDMAASGEQSKLADLGHKLKGMSLNVGAVHLSDLGKEIEFKAKSGESDAIEAILNQLDSVLDQTLSEMKGMI